MNNLQLSIAALFVSSSPLIHAAEETLSPVIVTATRTAQTVDEALASVTVITRDDIESSQSHSVLELIQSRTVGVDLNRNGGLGTNTSLLMRGTNSNHVLVLIDGVRVNSSIDGGFKWANLPLEQIERIEIVRGSRSTLYGSDAIGGVVQIFTRQGKGFHALIGGGSYNTLRTELGAGGALGKGNYHINAGYLESEGFSAKKPGSYNYEADNDGYLNTNIGAGINYPLGDSAKLALNLLHSAGEVETDTGSSTQLNDSASLAIDWASSENWQQTFNFGHAEDHYETSDGYLVHSLRNSVDWQHDIQIGDASLATIGIDYVAENGESDGDYNENIDNSALFAQYQWDGDTLDLLLGVRSDEHSELGGYETSQIAIGSKFAGGRIYASYGSAFKAPTFLQRFYPSYGNPTLLPEESVTTELGYRIGGLQTSLFDTRIENLIEFTFPAGYSNVSVAHIQGIELEYDHRVGSWKLNGGLTLQLAKDEDTNEKLLRRAEKKYFFTAGGPLSADSNIGIEVSYTGPRLDRGDVELPAYTLVNLNSEYRITRQWALSGRVENLLDEDYELASGYNTPRLSAYANIKYKM